MASNSAVQIGTWRRAIKGMRSNGSSKYHYEWNFNDGNSGFIVHGKKRSKWLRKKYKMFIDSNGNGILDNSDALISKGKLAKSFRKQRPGRLIEKNADGIITAKTYEAHNHSNHGHAEHDHGELFPIWGNPESMHSALNI